jgi:cytochrome P450 family 142 subfamily A polypeptide 1
LIPTAVEEMLRWVTPIKNMVRTLTRDAEVRGTMIPEGAEVMLLYPSANRDETVFEIPDEFDIERDPNPHLAFGFGPHFCLGNQLARLELRLMFERLFERLPDLSLVDDTVFTQRPSNFVSGLESMPVTFTPTPKLIRDPA